MENAKIQNNLQINELSDFFDWFDNTITPKIKEECSNFWESDFELKLFSITKSDSIKNDAVSKNETYFAHKIQLNKQQDVTIRLSSNFIRIFLHVFFGSSSPKFDIMALTELEIKILNSFSKSLYDGIKSCCVDYKTLPKNLQNDKGNYNLTFLLRKPGYRACKIVVSLPRNCIIPTAIQLKPHFVFEDFCKVSTYVDLRMGTTKITLSELKNLSPGDIILLEISNINRVKIIAGEVKTDFKISPDPTLIIDLDENEHDIGGEHMTKNIWDDIQIEVNAEFSKVKMTLGELKQISNGMVIDLGDIFNNKISLVVEDKVVAKGELVIINDKYGVKLSEIISNNPNGIQEVPKQPINPNIKAVPQAKVPLPRPKTPTVPKQEPIPGEKTADADEDFDYSDFEEDKKG